MPSYIPLTLPVHNYPGCTGMVTFSTHRGEGTGARPVVEAYCSQCGNIPTFSTFIAAHPVLP